MRVLVVGSGAREHALAWRLGLDGCDVLVAPGNGGTSGSVRVPVDDLAGLADLAARERVDLSLVGPEVPLAAGLVDVFAARGLLAFGPTRAAARIESSKGWAKDFFRRHGVPTAMAEVVETEAAARRALAGFGLPAVLKADGLAAGKGVFLVHTLAEVEDALDALFRRQTLGPAAAQVLVEEYLEGVELSVLAFADGERLAVMPPARDYKRVGDGDRGPNTGGMGGFSRPRYATPDLLGEVERTILEPTLAGLAGEGVAYRGVLYAGLMLTPGGPRVLEFNCRFGDPEAELILPLLDGSLAETCLRAAHGALDPSQVRWADGRTYGVVLAAPGYPEAPRLGGPIDGLDRLDRLAPEPGPSAGATDALAAARQAVLAFHGGTARRDGQVVTSGGRVLTLVGTSRQAVYAAAEAVEFAGKHYRTDIGLDESTPVGAASAPGPAIWSLG